MNGYVTHAPLVAWVKDVNGNDAPAPISALGIQANPDLSADSALVPWFTKRWPSTLPADQPMRIRVATSDATASTDWLNVYANAIGQPHSSGPGGTMPVPALPDPSQPVVSPNPPSPPDSLAHAISVPGATPLRVILNSPLGGAPAVVLDLAAPTSARVDVFDVQGRRLVTLADRSFPAGANVLAWDGRDAGGARMSRGLYFVRMSTPERVSTARFFLDR